MLRAIVVGPEQRKLAALRERVEDRAPPGPGRERGAAASAPVAGARRRSRAERSRRPSNGPSPPRSRPKPQGRWPMRCSRVMGRHPQGRLGEPRRMVDSLNRTLEHSLSWRSLNWRVEALRTGRSFGEIVLLNHAVYRVEQVFLIDRTSGRCCQHVARRSVERSGRRVGVGHAHRHRRLPCAISFRVSDRLHSTSSRWAISPCCGAGSHGRSSRRSSEGARRRSCAPPAEHAQNRFTCTG